MDFSLINIGFGNIVAGHRIIAIVSPDSAPIKRLVSDAREQGRLIDATYGRRTRSVLIMDSQHSFWGFDIIQSAPPSCCLAHDCNDHPPAYP
jgi:regulator of extracellular matrix RemA (YlzA/DUF370 family)